MLRLVGATVRYGSVTALDGVDLSVADGEKVSLLGPSGSGKTTLLRAVAGLEPLSAGRVSWDGRDLAGVPPHARGFGLMFQEYVLFPHRDVAGNVAFGLRMRGDPPARIAARVDEVLALVGLAGFGGRRITELSGGEQQRVALARALAPEPRLLMLDEPLGALDRALRSRLTDELAALFAELRLTILYVTHDQEEALALGDRVAVMRAGRVEAVDRPEVLWRRPPSEFVAEFLGLANVCTAPLSNGVARTPWGPVELAGVAGAIAGAAQLRLLLRPESFRPATNGPICGVVSGRAFRGDRVHLRLAVDGAPELVIHADWPQPPALGESLCVEVAPGGAVVLDEESRYPTPVTSSTPISTSATSATAGPPEVGQPAPDFELPDDSGAMRRLSDARGRWLVLYFYPKDDTPGCATEACEFRDAHPQVVDRGAEVWGISILGSGSKAAFKAKLGLPFALLADEEHAVAERYGTWVEKENYGKRYMGIQRATLLIDPAGVIRRVWPKVRPEGHAAEVLDALAQEQAAQARE